MREREQAARRFRTIGIITVVAVYFLIMVGGVVRSTGAGMGCPDWPKCFGTWVPPTDVSQLPANYQQIYADRGYGSTEFNPVKTWIEYANRLVGVLIGFFIFVTLLFSLPYLRIDPPVFYLSLVSFLLVGFQGWLGSKVVATNLMPLMISAHMVVALILVGLLIYAVARSQKEAYQQQQYPQQKGVYLYLWLGIGLSMVQILLGIQVREAVDAIAELMGQQQRGSWIEQIGTMFYAHRSFSLALVLVNGLLFLRLRKLPDLTLHNWAAWLLAVVGLEIAAGIWLAYFGIPAFLQPVHLLLATLLIGAQFLILIKYYYATSVPTARLVAA